jgi:hypothetical protein
MSNQAVKAVLWWVCLVAAPAVLVSIELFHPAGFTAHPGMYQFLSHAQPHEAQYQALEYFGPNWWVILHMIQTPCVGLVGVGLWLLVDPIDENTGRFAFVLAWLARAATLVFVIYYTALDATGGVGLGRAILTTQAMAANGQLTPQQVDGVILLLNTIWVDPVVGGVGSFISQTGSWAIFVAATAAAIALFLARPAAWPPAILLVAFGWELQTSHASPHGPIAFALLIVAAVWLGVARHRSARYPVATAIS